MTQTPSAREKTTGKPDVEFSLVVTTLDNATELPRLIESIDEQSVGSGAVEVLVFDLNSSDGTVELLQAWKARAAFHVAVEQGESLAAARNRGIASARGRWVSFPEPGAILDRDYLSNVRSFTRRHKRAVLVVPASRTIDSDSGIRNDDHPLTRRFAGGDQLVDLDKRPEYFHRSPAAAFLRSSLLRESGLEFAPSMFSGTQLVTRYLLECKHRLVGYAASAEYVRRPRSVNHVASRELTENGPLEAWRNLLDECGGTARSTVPEWVQRAALDTLAESLSDDGRARGGWNSLAYRTTELLRDALDAVMKHVESYVLQSYDLRGFGAERRDVLLYGSSGEHWHSPYVVATKYDPRRQQVRIAYRFTGDRPDELVSLRGEAVEPISAKTRICEYFGHTLLFERILWLPASGEVRVKLNDEVMEIRSRWDPARSSSSQPAPFAKWFGLGEPNTASRQSSVLGIKRTILRIAASTPYAHRRFDKSWVLLDRMHEGDDNAERLFEYLRQQRPDINAWFVIEKGTADWHRLRKSQFRRRVIAYRSIRWYLLMLNCTNVASSHLHGSIHRPPQIAAIATPKWLFTFLQHGVIKDDISRWVNKIDVDLFIVSTPDEFTSLTADCTPYAYTTKEVQLTGLPRFDRLRRKADEAAASDKRYILVCPTWRDWLCKPMVPGTQVRPLIDNFLDSEYVRTWTEFLGDSRLAAHAKQHGLEIGFMPHPNFQAELKDVQMPDGVRVLTYSDNDVQQLIAQSVVMVTDYSSIAFNAAYVDQPVVYFQFDAAQINAGGHNYRPGYFDYQQDAFGPVVETVDEAVSATMALSDVLGLPPEYKARIDRAFPNRSGGCCARVTAAIEAANAGARARAV